MKNLSDAEFLRQMLALLGTTTTARLLGWATLSSVGAPADADRRWLLEHGWGSLSARYRNVAALTKLRDHLVAEGFDIGGAPARAESPAMGQIERLVGAMS